MTRDNIEHRIQELKESIDEFYKDPDEVSDKFKEHMGDVIICGYKHSAADTLEEIDPNAYDQELSNFADGLDKEDFSSYNRMTEELDEMEEQLELLNDEY